MKTLLWILLALTIMACSSMMNAVDYDDLYAMKHYDYQGNSIWYQYQRSYVQPPLYYNYGFNPWFYPHERIVVQKIYVPQNQDRVLIPGKRPDRESNRSVSPYHNRGTKRD